MTQQPGEIFSSTQPQAINGQKFITYHQLGDLARASSGDSGDDNRALIKFERHSRIRLLACN